MATACGSCGAPTGDGAYLDAGCTRDLAGQLLLAASIASDLDDAVARLIKRGSGGKSSGHEVPLPIDLAAAEVAADLQHELRRWRDFTLEFKPPVPYSWPGARIDVMARWLAIRVGIMRQMPGAATAKRDITAAVARALAVIDRLPERVPAGQCEACGAVLLADLETDTATCRCGNVVTGLIDERYRRATEADQLGTPAELVGYCRAVGVTIKRGTITSWVARKQLLPRPGGAYALSDVLTLKAQSTARVAR